MLPPKYALLETENWVVDALPGNTTSGESVSVREPVEPGPTAISLAVPTQFGGAIGLIASFPSPVVNHYTDVTRTIAVTQFDGVEISDGLNLI